MKKKKRYKSLIARKLRYFYLRFLRLKGAPHYIARGMAIGIFIGMTPTIPFHTVTALFIAFIFKQHKLASFLGIQVGLFAPVIYLASYKLGAYILGTKPLHFNANLTSITEIYKLGYDILLPLFVGNIPYAFAATIAGYLITLKIMKVKVVINNKISGKNLVSKT